MIPLCSRPPLVLAIGGHDPSGAGIQADIEAAAMCGCHAITLVTCLTVQNTAGVESVIPTPRATLERQFTLMREDTRPFAACKIGLLPSTDSITAVAGIVDGLPAGTPVVLDPVLASGSGTNLSTDAVRATLVAELWPLATVRTPNARELRLLAAATGRSTEELLAASPGWTLVKGADEPTPEVAHQLFHNGDFYAEFCWPRLDGSFHGSGCTLATATAAQLSRGMSVPSAVGFALAQTWRSLFEALDIGGAQLLPNRRRGRCWT